MERAVVKMKIQEQVVDYIIKRAETLANELDLVVCYGSYVTGNATPLSDVDTFYIPRKERRELSETFILNEVGYDIFPLGWEILQEIADFNISLAPLIGDSTIIFSRSEKERQRFEELRRKMAGNLVDERFMQERGAQRLSEANKLAQKIHQLSDVSVSRELAGKQLVILSEAIAYKNQTYFHKGLKEHDQELQKMAQLPKGFLSLYQRVIQAQKLSDLQAACQEIFATVCSFYDYQADPTVVLSVDRISEAVPDHQQAAAWYEEVCSSFNKIYACKQSGNYSLAFLTACSLQSTLKEDLSIELATTDLLSVFSFEDLAPLAERARTIQQDCVERILADGGTLHCYQSVVELYQRHGLAE